MPQPPQRIETSNINFESGKISDLGSLEFADEKTVKVMYKFSFIKIAGDAVAQYEDGSIEVPHGELPSSFIGKPVTLVGNGFRLPCSISIDQDDPSKFVINNVLNKP